MGQYVQSQFTFLPTTIPQGDGSYIVKPGKPQSKLRVKEAALLAGCSRDGIYRLIEMGMLRFERPTRNCIRVFADSLQEHLQKTRDGEFWDGKPMAK